MDSLTKIYDTGGHLSCSDCGSTELTTAITNDGLTDCPHELAIVCKDCSAKTVIARFEQYAGVVKDEVNDRSDTDGCVGEIITLYDLKKDLSIRLYNGLCKAGVDPDKSLVAWVSKQSIYALFKKRDMGNKSVIELLEILSGYGLDYSRAYMKPFTEGFDHVPELTLERFKHISSLLGYKFVLQDSEQKLVDFFGEGPMHIELQEKFKSVDTRWRAFQALCDIEGKLFSELAAPYRRSDNVQ